MSQPSQAPLHPAHRTGGRAGRRRVGGLVLGLSLLAAALATPARGPAGARPAQAETDHQLRVAVVDFDSATTEADLKALGKGLQSMVATDLAGVPGLRLVERQRLNDVIAELKLARGGQMDRATVARVGKLTGATHLLGGTYTVVAGRMRIDARMFSIESGEVIVAEQIEGERDAFFELEKTLARKVVDALGIKLAPRDRAALATPHTADFEAFRLYSKGIAAFDERRYDDALTALGAAARKDTEFRLAARTLEDYRRLVTEIRAKAAALDSAADTRAEMKVRAEEARRSTRWGPIIEQLWTMAAAPGEGQAQQDRIAATLLLREGYRRYFELRSPHADRFALDRMAEDLERRYLADVAPLFPRLPPVIVDAWSDPAPGQPVLAWVRATHAELERLMTPSRREQVIREMSNQINEDQTHALNGVIAAGGLEERLQLDQGQVVRFAERLGEWIQRLSPDVRQRAGVRSMLASLQRSILEVDRDTAYWTEESRTAKDARELRIAAAHIDGNLDLLRIIRDAPDPALGRELILINGVMNGATEVDRAKGRDAAVSLMSSIDSARQLSGFMLIGTLPVWHVRSLANGAVQTGPRSDRCRAAELRYWPHRLTSPTGNAPARPLSLVVVEGRPHADLEAAFQVSFAIPDELRISREVGYGYNVKEALKHAPKVPPAEVGYALGIQNAIAGEGTPTTGFAVVLGRRAARLIRFVLARNKDSVEATTLEEHPLSIEGTSRLEVTVRVKSAGTGAAIELTVNGRTVDFHARDAIAGFHGFLLGDTGYASLGKIRVRAP